jgi:hypothetical protein
LCVICELQIENCCTWLQVLAILKILESTAIYTNEFKQWVADRINLRANQFKILNPFFSNNLLNTIYKVIIHKNYLNSQNIEDTVRTVIPSNYSIHQLMNEHFSALDRKLFEGAKTGNLTQIETALREGANIRAVDSTHLNHTGLHWAAECGKQAAVEFLISRGANVNARNLINNHTPRDIALILHPNIAASLPAPPVQTQNPPAQNKQFSTPITNNTTHKDQEEPRKRYAKEQEKYQAEQKKRTEESNKRNQAFFAESKRKQAEHQKNVNAQFNRIIAREQRNLAAGGNPSVRGMFNNPTSRMQSKGCPASHPYREKFGNGYHCTNGRAITVSSGKRN